MHIQVLAGTGLPAGRSSRCCPLGRWGRISSAFAAGDRIRLREDGTADVLARGGNLCIRMYPATPPPDARIAVLTAAFAELGGLVEMPLDRRFIVITAPIGAGFPAVEGAASSWADEQGCAWEFGNVYDDNGDVLDRVAASWSALEEDDHDRQDGAEDSVQETPGTPCRAGD